MSSTGSPESEVLAGQLAVVTGGGRGLGRAFAIGLAAAGASVAVIARSKDQLAETVRIIAEAGGQGTAFVGDVSDPRTVENLATQTEARLGAVDLLMSSYVVAKAALIRFSEIIAAETRSQNITVFAIEPGTVRTAMAQIALESEAGRRCLPWFGKLFEARRDVPPDHAVSLVLRLASGQADALSGRFITVSDNLERMLEGAEEIKTRDLYTLRLRTEGDNRSA